MLCILPSCEERLYIDLKTSEPRLVIDASLENMNSCIVYLYFTQGYWDEHLPTPVIDAKVTLSNDLGETEELSKSYDGVYTSSMQGIEGRTYTLTVEVDGKKYSATEFLPYAVPVDRIRTYKFDTGGDVNFFPCIGFIDPRGIENYYYYLLEINGRRLDGVRYDDDKHSDGKFKEKIILFDDDEREDDGLIAGDYVWVELQSICKGAHTFYKTQKPSTGIIPDSNPISNFSGGVLGMFKTYSSSFIEISITEEDLQ